jgi:hypothetical protein
MPRILNGSALSTVLVALWLAAGCADNTPPKQDRSSDRSTADGQPRPELGLPDKGPPPKPRTKCTVANATVVYEDKTDHAGWLPRMAWSNDQYGIVWRQELAPSSTIVSHAAFARLDKDGKLQGTVSMLTKDPTVLSAAAGPQVAVSGLKDGFLLVWGDTRGGSGATNDLYLLQLNGAGVPVDKGNPCSTPGCGQVKVTSSGSAGTPYLVRPSFVDIDQTTTHTSVGLAWRDDRSLTSVPYPPYTQGRGDIFFKVLNFDGTDNVAEQRITTDKSKTRPDWPVMAFDGTNYALVWRDTTDFSSSELFFAFVSGAGKVKLAEQSLTVNQGLLSSPPDLVWAGADYGISFSSNPSASTGQVKFARITGAGALLAQQKVSTLGFPCTPAVSYNGEHYGIAWQDNCGQAGSKLVFALIDDSGSPLQPDGKSCFQSADPSCGLVTVPPDTEGTAAFPSMISVGGNFAVAWMNAPKRRIQFAQIICTAP